MQEPLKRAVFIVSDRTGITVEALGKSLLSQFEGVEFERIIIPYVDSVEKAQNVAARIDAAVHDNGAPPVVLSSMVDDECRAALERSKGVVLDFFATFVGPMEMALGVEASHTVGKSHGMGDGDGYSRWIDAVNFALSHDDGQRLKRLDTADLILVGVSRSGKTPTSLYLAMQFGIRAANYPLTEDDLETADLPGVLKPYKGVLFGLTISPERLSRIRQERRPDSRYASLEQCRREVQRVERMLRSENIPYLNTTSMSIEELASGILVETGMKRRAAVVR